MIFVTGGTGLVGSHLLLALLQKGEKVRALKRENSNTGLVRQVFSGYITNADELFDRIEWVDGDILDVFSLEKLLEGVDLIYHCAAIVSFDPRQRNLMIRNNVEGTANLVNAAIQNGVKRICHASSVSALGKTGNGEPVSEETNWIPSKKHSGYAQSKFHSETEIWRGVEEGLQAVVVNPSIIIGPGNWSSGSPALFGHIYKGMKFYPGGSNGYVGVQDVVNAMLLLTSEENFGLAKNNRFLLNAANLSFKEFFTKVAKSLNKPAPTIPAGWLALESARQAAALASFLTGKPALITRETVASGKSKTAYDGSKITRMFGFNYQNIDEAIETTGRIFLNSRMENQ